MTTIRSGVINPHLATARRQTPEATASALAAPASSSPADSSAIIGHNSTAPEATSIEPPSSPLRSFGLGALALLSVASVGISPAQAAGLREVVPSTSTSLSLASPTIPADTLAPRLTPTGVGSPLTPAADTTVKGFSYGLTGPLLQKDSTSSWRVDVGTSNDSNLFPAMGGIIPQQYRIPGSLEADDDGWTAGFRIDATRTRGNEQWVFSTRYDMITETGAWVPPPDYGARRTDLGQFAVQRNVRTPLGSDGRTHLITGLGAGVEAVGQLGGYDIQNGFHRLGWFGGRIGPENGLQTHYTSGILASPMITGGVGVEHDVDGTGRLFVNSSLTANAALGPGLSSARARVGLTAFPTSWLRVDAAAHLDAVHVQSSSLDFAHLNGVRPGWEVRLEGTSSRYVTPFVKVEYGGLKNDFNYIIGFSIPLGGGGSARTSQGPWLDPIHR